MTSWNPTAYLRFGEERTRPAVDLVARIQLEAPKCIVDLGCGPGNSTAVLARRWPSAQVLGVDNAAAMIAAAAQAHPSLRWATADIATWQPPAAVDLVFSNAALQWLPDHASLIPRLFGAVASGGALAFQIPSATHALVRTLIHAIAREGPWAARMQPALGALTLQPPGFYHDLLAPLARSIDVWETDYPHVMEGHDAIVAWIASTGLRPFLAALDTEAERQLFRDQLLQRVEENDPVQADGRILFPFRRTFVIAYAGWASRHRPCAAG
jgi:trans-aconitate 2-methyltransferase